MPQSFPTQSSACAFCRPDFCSAQKNLWGCTSICQFLCDRNNCDYTCPCRLDEFLSRWREVGGLDPTETSPLLAPHIEDLPSYLPLIQHSSKFDEVFDAPFAAIPTFKALATTRQKQLDAMGLRQRFKLSQNAKVLAVSVAKDPPLELYWRHRNSFDLPHKIAEWGITAITVPNFSYFPDAPSLHTYWNFRRMQRVAEEFSNAGVAIIPHVNTLDDVHRIAWANVLRGQPELKWVAKEFQTGAKHQDMANQAFEDLCRLQDDVGLDIHPILVGGARMCRRLTKHFRSFTIVDSHPFMLTINRHEVVIEPHGIVRSQQHQLPKGTALDSLWRQNLQRYSHALKERQLSSLIAVSPRLT